MLNRPHPLPGRTTSKSVATALSSCLFWCFGNVWMLCSCGVDGIFPNWVANWMDISVKELVPVVVAAALRGGLWQGYHIRFYSDNMAVVSILNTKTSKAPQVMHLPRCFSFYCAFYCAFYCFRVSCMHVPGAINAAADALSHNNLPLFSLVPQACQYAIPTALVELLITSIPDWGLPAWTQQFIRSLAKASPSLHWDLVTRVCTQFKCCPLPVTETTLLRFVAHLASSDLTHQTVWLYLCAVRHLHIVHNLPDPALTSYPLLNYALRGFRQGGCRHELHTRLPNTAWHSAEDLLAMVANSSGLDHVMLWAAFCLGFFGFML